MGKGQFLVLKDLKGEMEGSTKESGGPEDAEVQKRELEELSQKQAMQRYT